MQASVTVLRRSVFAKNACCLAAVCMFVCGSAFAQTRQTDNSPAPQVSITEATTSGDQDESSQKLREVLQPIRDNDWLRSDETAAYYYLLQLADTLDQSELAARGRRFVNRRQQAAKLPTFPDMILNPEEFRGQPIVLKGHVVQIIEYEAEENDYGITQLYEASLFTDDSQSNPTTIVFQEKPADLPLGQHNVDGVTVAGFFMKVYRYPASDLRDRKAPLILAKTVSVAPASQLQPARFNAPTIYTVIALLVAAFVMTIVLVQRADRQRMLAAQRRRLADELQPVETANSQVDQDS